MKPDFEARVKSIEWSRLPHPCLQDQTLIPELLIELCRGDDHAKERAAVRLWDTAAHQGNVGPSSVPTAGFLVEILESLPPLARVESLDTLYQFSNCLIAQPWSADLQRIFREALPIFERLRESHDEDASDFSGMIIENIEAAEGQRAEPGAAPNGGPAMRSGYSRVSKGVS